MDRRTFLRRTATTAAGLSLAETGIAADAGALPPVKPVDTHIHLYDPNRPEGVPWPPKSDALLYRPHLPQDFREIAARNDLAGAIVIEASPWFADNQWVLDLVQDEQLIVGFIGHLSPSQPDFSGQLQALARNPLFRGIRLDAASLASGLERPEWVESTHRLAEANLAVDLLGGPKILADATRLAKLAPGLRIVIDHLPYPEWDENSSGGAEALHGLAEAPNVFAKVSAVVRAKQGQPILEGDHYHAGLQMLTEIFGLDRLIYGSNWPVSNHVAPYPVILKVVTDYFRSLGREAEEKFFQRNSVAAYQWVPRKAGVSL